MSSEAGCKLSADGGRSTIRIQMNIQMLAAVTSCAEWPSANRSTLLDGSSHGKAAVTTPCNDRRTPRSPPPECGSPKEVLHAGNKGSEEPQDPCFCRQHERAAGRRRAVLRMTNPLPRRAGRSGCATHFFLHRAADAAINVIQRGRHRLEMPCRGAARTCRQARVPTLARSERPRCTGISCRGGCGERHAEDVSWLG